MTLSIFTRTLAQRSLRFDDDDAEQQRHVECPAAPESKRARGFNYFGFYEPAAVIGPAEVRVRIMRTNWSAV
jgi:hypothetical protein